MVIHCIRIVAVGNAVIVIVAVAVLLQAPERK